MKKRQKVEMKRVESDTDSHQQRQTERTVREKGEDRMKGDERKEFLNR